MKQLAIFAVIALVLSSCGSGTPVTFQNSSEHRLEQVVLSGSGFEKSLAAVSPGQLIRARVHPTGESALAVSFTAKGQHFNYEPQGYFEGGGMYKVSATVGRDLSVVVDSEIGPY